MKTWKWKHEHDYMNPNRYWDCGIGHGAWSMDLCLRKDAKVLGISIPLPPPTIAAYEIHILIWFVENIQLWDDEPFSNWLRWRSWRQYVLWSYRPDQTRNITARSEGCLRNCLSRNIWIQRLDRWPSCPRINTRRKILSVSHFSFPSWA